MGILNRIKEKVEEKVEQCKVERRAVEAVEEAKEREINNQKTKRFEDEAREFAEKLGVTVEEAIIYLRKEKKKKQTEQTKKHFIEVGNKVIKTVGKWSEGTDKRLTETKKVSDNPKEQLKEQPKKKKEKMNFDFAIGMLGGDTK